jgi:3-hydroxyacyl-[acyl-carrier-protein] dehydratase
VRFILVDEIVAMAAGESIHAVKTLDAEEDVFRDHFPGFPVVPAVLLTEMMAQAAGKCLDAHEPGRGKAMLVQIRKASFRKWVRPGQRADIHARITASTLASGTAACRIIVDDDEAARADLLFTFVPLAQFAEDFRDEVLERHLARHSDDLT